jgi:lambda family phage tail tape measure protein
MEVAGLSVKLGLVTVGFKEKTEETIKQAKDLQKSFNELGEGVRKVGELWKEYGVLVGAVGLGSLIEGTIELADQLDHLSKSYDLSISQTLTFRQALLSAGVNADGASKILSTLFSKIEEAKQGNDSAIASFERIGISFAEIKKLSPYEAIKKVASGLNDISDTFERVKAVKDLLGKAGIGASLEEIQQVLDAGTEKNDKYAESIERVAKLGEVLKTNLENLRVAFANVISPFVGTEATSIGKFEAIIKGLISYTVVSNVLKFAMAFTEVAIALKEASLAGALFNATAGGTTPIGLIIKGASIVAGLGAYKYISDQNAKPTAPQPVSAMGQFARDEENLDRQKSADQEHTVAVSKEVEAKQAILDLNYKILSFDFQRGKLTHDQVWFNDTLVKLAQEEINTKEKIAQIDAKRKEELAKMPLATQELKDITNALANVEIKRAENNLSNQRKLLLEGEKYKSFLIDMENMARLSIVSNEDEAIDLKRIDDIKTAQNNRILDARLQVKEEMRLNDLSNEKLNYENQLLMLSDRQQNYLKERNDLEAKITEYKFQQTKLGTDPKVIEQISNEMRKTGEETIRLKEQTIDTQKTFEYGWQNAFNLFQDNATNMAKISGDMFNSIMSNMDSALSNFVKTGKLNFKDFTRNIIQDLLLIQLKAQATKLLGGFLGSMFGNKYTEGSSSFVGPSQSYGSGNLFADGGSPPLGQVSLVGERGPELFVPKQSGTIIPNSKLGTMSMGTTNVTNNYINAIDTKSFEQRLLQSSTAIWAGYQYANKSLAVSTGRA